MPQVALSKDFLEAYSRVPKGAQKKVREFIEKFRRDPTQSGINFERVNEAQDDKVRSVRIDQVYRAIVVHPPKGDVYLCVWVDHHDDAYRWVRNKHFEVNPNSGVLQLYEVGDLSPARSAPSTTMLTAEANRARVVPQGLFASVNDEDLLLAGVPAPLLPSVRAVTTETDLDKLSPHLPEDVSDMLYLLAAGYSFVDALEEVERARARPATVDTQDFARALEEPQSQRQFRVIGDEHDLSRILDAPLGQWRIFLHPTQRSLVEMDAKGPVKVLGGAGTGKTVVLMHRARHLARQVFTGRDDRIFVTTFTRNLASDLEANLKNLCGEEIQRIDVINLHRWAFGFLRNQGIHLAIADSRDSDQAWQAAHTECSTDSYPLSFYKEEWERVVQAQNVSTPEAYLLATRVGRGTSLTRQQRANVWMVLHRYREILDSQKLVEWQDIVRETRLFIEKQRVSLPFRSVLADEVQDFTANELALLRAMVPRGPNDLFIVGDAYQRIYGYHTPLSRLGIETRGRSKRLKLNYRTTKGIRKYAVAIIEGCAVDDLDDGQDSLKGFWSLRNGSPPEVALFQTEGEEAKRIVGRLKGWLQQGAEPGTICVAARTHQLVRDRYRRILESGGIPISLIEADDRGGTPARGVRLATMHRMKGLEFMRVIVAGVQEGVVPWLPQNDGPADEASRRHRELQERSLLYVAATRARDELLITGFGRPSPFLIPVAGR